MPATKRLRGKNYNGVVVASAEILFTPGGIMGRWKSTLAGRTTGFAKGFAPSNKRPRWAHYGAPLKSTFKSSMDYDPGKLQAHMAIGSTSDHAVYPDQGTGIFGGNGPYQGKILPPWTPGSPSLYESTWRPNPRSAPNGTVTIKGQRGQFFMDRAVKAGLRSARVATATLPGGSSVSKVVDSAPDGLLNFLGNTQPSATFVAQLQEWRAWRDRAFNSDRSLGRDGDGGRVGASRRLSSYRRVDSGLLDRPRRTPAERRKQDAIRQQRRRDRVSEAKSTAKGRRPRKSMATKSQRNAEKTRFLKAMQKKWGVSNVDLGSLEGRNGYWYVTVRTKDAQGRTVFIERRGKATTI